MDVAHCVHELLRVSTVANAHHDVICSCTSQVSMHPLGSLSTSQIIIASVHVLTREAKKNSGYGDSRPNWIGAKTEAHVEMMVASVRRSGANDAGTGEGMTHMNEVC